MRWLVPIFASLLLACPASAVDFTCTLPNSLIVQAQGLCEELRVTLRVRSANWSNNICATQMLRLGLFEANRRSARAAAEVVAQQSVQTQVSAFESPWALPIIAVCGDGIIDIQFGEQCDDNNTGSGDGCSNACLTE